VRPEENYYRLIGTAFGLTLAILITFQIYLIREPARVQAVQAADLAAASEAGRQLYNQNCIECHGENGEGKVGPALNSRQLLEITSDQALFNLIGNGVPGTAMPAWGQTFGGPFSDEQLRQMVTFIRAWESTAPEILPEVFTPDPVRGATIFATTCFICHGENGQGSTRVEKLNDPIRLKDFGDAWYRDTIAYGRPAKGMPTWGTVLSPQQIDDLVALLGAWRAGETVTPNIPFKKHLRSAAFALRQFDPLDAEYHLNAALAEGDGSVAGEIRAILNLINQNDLSAAKTRLTGLLPPAEMGEELFFGYCAACHGADGTGGLGKNLHDNNFVQTKSDSELIEFILAGRRGTAMDGFQNILTAEQINDVIALLRTWQK